MTARDSKLRDPDARSCGRRNIANLYSQQGVASVLTTVRLMLRYDIGRQCSIASTRWIRALREEDFAARPVVLLPPSDPGGKILAEQVSTVAARAKLITALSRRTRSAAVSLRDVVPADLALLAPDRNSRRTVLRAHEPAAGTRG
jgi:hypothetical protein